MEGCRRAFTFPVSAFECAFWDGTPGLCTRRPDRIPLDRARWVWQSPCGLIKIVTYTGTEFRRIVYNRASTQMRVGSASLSYGCRTNCVALFCVGRGDSKRSDQIRSWRAADGFGLVSFSFSLVSSADVRHLSSPTSLGRYIRACWAQATTHQVCTPAMRCLLCSWSSRNAFRPCLRFG